MSVTVTTQAELDRAVADTTPIVYIQSPAGVWLRLLARDSSHVVALGSSHVVARGSSHVVARGSSHVEAGAWTAIHLHSQYATVTGGEVIDMTTVDRTDPQTWCDLHGIEVTDGTLVLYKALGDDLTAGQQYARPVTYTPGVTVTCDDWRDDHSCGGGLHLSPSPATARAYRTGATRYVAVRVALDDVRPIDDKVKVRRGVVLHEVDVRGRQVVAA